MEISPSGHYNGHPLTWRCYLFEQSSPFPAEINEPPRLGFIQVTCIHSVDLDFMLYLMQICRWTNVGVTIAYSYQSVVNIPRREMDDREIPT